MFLYNNLLLLALCLTIFWGVVYPLISEAVRGEAVVLGREYYDFFLRDLRASAAPAHGHRAADRLAEASLQSLLTTFRGRRLSPLATGLVLLALGAGSSIPGLIAYTFSAFVAATIALEFVRGTRARRHSERPRGRARSRR